MPQASENFRLLCTGEKGQSPSGAKLSYKGTELFRIIPGFMCQGGDITQGDGSGGESAIKFDQDVFTNTDADYSEFGNPGSPERASKASEFRDENFRIKHTEPGLLAYANRGRRHSNTSQFYITFDECKWYDA